MAANDVVMQRAQRSGVGLLQPALGLDALRAVMTGIMQPFAGSALVAVAPFEWGVLLKVRDQLAHFALLASHVGEMGVCDTSDHASEPGYWDAIRKSAFLPRCSKDVCSTAGNCEQGPTFLRRVCLRTTSTHPG